MVRPTLARTESDLNCHVSSGLYLARHWMDVKDAREISADVKVANHVALVDQKERLTMSPANWTDPKVQMTADVYIGGVRSKK